MPNRRKQLHNALGALGVGSVRIHAALAAAGIDPAQRAQTLTLDDWNRLSAAPLGVSEGAVVVALLQWYNRTSRAGHSRAVRHPREWSGGKARSIDEQAMYCPSQ